MKNENMRWDCTLIRMNLMNEKDTMDEIGNMDVFGHMDGMTFMDEIEQHPYILIWLTLPNATVLSDQIHQLKLFHPFTEISSMPFNWYYQYSMLVSPMWLGQFIQIV